ncbi:C40 family peptidase [Nonomuraea sp. NPDC026600]|uniref:C40 family peptidase n=1 Tax=Nonomuraea sp. NPDC026600 TaxID=3155363 RepID=UPI0033D1048C
MTVTAGGVVLHAPTAQATTAREPASVSRTTTTAGKTVKSVKKTAHQTAVARQQARARTAVSVAKDQLGDPYRYGATGPGSFDCSGLVQYAWKKAGVKIPRVTNSQFAGIKKKVSWKNLKPGDLLFFHGLGHVGMFVGNGKMIHSPRTGQTVRIEKLNGWRKASFAGAVRPGL